MAFIVQSNRIIRAVTGNENPEGISERTSLISLYLFQQ